jgi:fucose 4-O-acetylase-like acetyltransferase
MGNGTSDRDLTLDVLKGGAIILVVLGHTVTDWRLAQFIFSLHMPLFFFLSGMTASIQYRRTGVDLSRRAWALLTPYATWLILLTFTLSAALVSKLGLAALNPRAGLWYLYVLFALWLVLWLLDRLPGRLEVGVIALCAIFIVAPHVGGIEPYSGQQLADLASNRLSAVNTGPGLLGWRSVAWFFPFFGAGFLTTSDMLRSRLRSWRWVLPALAWTALIALAWPPIAVPGEVPATSGFGLNGYFYAIYRYALAFAGTAAAIGILNPVRGVLRSGLAWLGQRTLAIYLVHGLFLGMVPLMWGWLPRIVQSPMQWVSVATFSITMSALTASAIRRNPVAASLLLGARWTSLSAAGFARHAGLASVTCVILIALSRHGTFHSNLVEVAIILLLAIGPMVRERFVLKTDPV